jgi:hypothetical protein
MHIRCPHCRNPIEVVEQDSLSDATRPSCGSNFSLIGEENTHTQRAKVKRVAHSATWRRRGSACWNIAA